MLLSFCYLCEKLFNWCEKLQFYLLFILFLMYFTPIIIFSLHSEHCQVHELVEDCQTFHFLFVGKMLYERQCTVFFYFMLLR